MKHNLFAPTVRVELNAETAPFFDPVPDHLSTLGQALFTLGCVGSQQRLFAGRLAPLKAQWAPELPWEPEQNVYRGESSSNYVTWVPVVREVHRNPDGSLRPGDICLALLSEIDALFLRRGVSPTGEDIRRFWAANVFLPDSPGDQCSVPYFDQSYETLCRFYYHHPLDVGFVMFHNGLCWFGSGQEPESESRRDVNETEIGVEWMTGDVDPDEEVFLPLLGAQALTRLSAQEFRARVEALLGDAGCELGYKVAFHLRGERERCQEALKCTPLVRRLAQKKCEVEVLQTINVGGELDGCVRVRCWPWVNEPMEVVAANAESKEMAMPPALQRSFAAICSQLGARAPLPAPPTDDSPDSLRQKAHYHWASGLHFEVKEGSAHEKSARLSDLHQEIAALEAELAATSTT